MCVSGTGYRRGKGEAGESNHVSLGRVIFRQLSAAVEGRPNQLTLKVCEKIKEKRTLYVKGELM